MSRSRPKDRPSPPPADIPRETGGLPGLEKVAVMAALNIASDYLRVRQSEERFSVDVASRVKDLKEKLEQNVDYG